MQVQITTTTVKARPYVGVRRRVPAQGIGDACREILPRVGRWLGEKGLAPDGMPITVYHAHDAAAAEFDLQPGFFLAPGAIVEPEDDITCDVTAAGEAATAVHVGSYDSLGETWDAVFSWVREHGRTCSQASWEIYETDPGADPDPANWRTRIVVPLD